MLNICNTLNSAKVLQYSIGVPLTESIANPGAPEISSIGTGHLKRNNPVAVPISKNGNLNYV